VECPETEDMDFPTCVLWNHYMIIYIDKEQEEYSESEESEEEESEPESDESEPEEDEESSEESAEDTPRVRRRRPSPRRGPENKGNKEDFGDIMVFDIRAYKWEKVELRGDQPKPRTCNTINRYQEDKIIVYGGECSNVTNEVLVWTVEMAKGKRR